MSTFEDHMLRKRSPRPDAPASPRPRARGMLGGTAPLIALAPMPGEPHHPTPPRAFAGPGSEQRAAMEARLAELEERLARLGEQLERLGQAVERSMQVRSSNAPRDDDDDDDDDDDEDEGEDEDEDEDDHSASHRRDRARMEERQQRRAEQQARMAEEHANRQEAHARRMEEHAARRAEEAAHRDAERAHRVQEQLHRAKEELHRSLDRHRGQLDGQRERMKETAERIKEATENVREHVQRAVERAHSRSSESEGEQVDRFYALPEGRREAVIELMSRPDVPILVRPAPGGIEVQATERQHEVFKAFIDLIAAREESKSYKLSHGKLEALTKLMTRDDVPVTVQPGEDGIGVRGNAGVHTVFGSFLNLIEPGAATEFGGWRHSNESALASLFGREEGLAGLAELENLYDQLAIETEVDWGDIWEDGFEYIDDIEWGDIEEDNDIDDDDDADDDEDEEDDEEENGDEETNLEDAESASEAERQVDSQSSMLSEILRILIPMGTR